MADQDNGTNGVATVELHEEMEDSFMQFALSVIVGRALPDARDGLKPSQRRILLAMYDDGVTATGRHVKCATIVGETIKTYHPHGDLALYQTLVRMAQDFSLRYPLIDPQGNFGSIDGDPAGAARYTEARLSHIAAAMLEDLDKDTVDWQPNYDERSEEPEVLPAGFPNLVCNGVTGIAVGYATNMPPHNLGEVVEAACARSSRTRDTGVSFDARRRLPPPDARISPRPPKAGGTPAAGRSWARCPATPQAARSVR